VLAEVGDLAEDGLDLFAEGDAVERGHGFLRRQLQVGRGMHPF